jgi:hypothetical protein
MQILLLPKFENLVGEALLSFDGEEIEGSASDA